MTNSLGCHLHVRMAPVDQLIPYSRNSRTHSKEQIAEIEKSIQTFGWTNPILVRPNNVIIAGHARHQAAQNLGLTHVPVIEVPGLSETQYRALAIADNRLALNAGWDEDTLRMEIVALKEDAFDLDVLGFEDEEIELLAKLDAPAPDEDAVPDAPKTPVSRPLDLWLLDDGKGNARHRVLCGDATNGETVARLLKGHRTPFLMETDPPYGVNLEPEWREKAGLNSRTRQEGKVVNDHQFDWAPAWALFPGDVAYIWHAALHAGEVARALESCDFLIRAQIIWDKQHFAISRGAYHWQHEPCWYAVRDGKTAHWRGGRTQSTVWEVPNLNPFGGTSGNAENEISGHGTQKPVEIMRRPILNHTTKGEVVYDPFLGSGTTLVACELTGRICYGIEIDSHYVDVIVQRWQNLTHREATLAGDCRSFQEIALARLKEL